MNEVKFKVWQVILGLLGTMLATGMLIISVLAHDLEGDKHRFDQYKHSFHEYNEDRKQKGASNEKY